MLLNLSGYSLVNKHVLGIHFVEHTGEIVKHLKTAERVLWVSYGYAIDTDTFPALFDTKGEVTILPSPTGDVDWTIFKKGVLECSTEPIDQMGLVFDTDVGTPISDGMYTVKKSKGSVMIIDGKNVMKKLRNRKGEGVRIPKTSEELIERFREHDVKMQAYTKARVRTIAQYECVGNIMNAQGVSFKS